MPYIFDLETQEWPENAGDDYEPPPPKASEFEFMPPHEFLGQKPAPIFFTEPGAEPAEPPSQSKPGLLARIFGLAQTPLGRGKPSESYLDAELLAALRAAGVAEMRVRYDGGDDEGFAWFKSATSDAGEILDAEGLIGRMDLAPDPQHPNLGAEHRLDGFAGELGAIMLGRGFGTGPFYMFGEFTANLTTRELRDDPEARAFKENIEIDPDG